MASPQSRRNALRSRRLMLESLEDRRVMAYGAEMVADLAGPLQPQDSRIRDFVEVNGTTFFTATTSTTGTELWKTDGTAAGTVLVKDVLPGSMSSSPRHLLSANGKLFFVADDGQHGRELWTSDGTQAGTRLLADLGPGNSDAFPPQASVLAVGDSVYFGVINQATISSLWKTDGSEAGTVLVKEFWLGWGPEKLTAFDGKLYFSMYGPEVGYELWTSDGTEAGTHTITDVSPATGYSEFEMMVAGETLFFKMQRDNNVSLWKTDGTITGAQKLDDIGTKSNSDLLKHSYVPLNGQLYFTAFDEVHGRQIWKSDGTSAGTVRVTNFTSGSSGTRIENLRVFNGRLLFTATMEGTNSEIWSSDGTAEGTLRLTTLSNGYLAEVVPQSLTQMGDHLYFRAGSIYVGYGLWKTDGTAAGTTLVMSMPGSDLSLQYTDKKLFHSNNALYFSGYNPQTGGELWRSDGTGAGTWEVRDIAAGDKGSDPMRLQPVGDQLFFSAAGDNNSPYHNLWKTSGSQGDVQHVSSIRSNQRHATDSSASFNGFLYFSGDRNVAQMTGLWKSDGTDAGTVLVKDVPALNIVTMNGSLYFSSGTGLWKSDGTESGTVLLKTIGISGGPFGGSAFVEMNGMLYFAGNDGVHGTELWKTDGTPEGTVQVTDITSQYDVSPQDLVNVNGTLYFTIWERDSRRLWKSDGTEAGTVRVSEVPLGPYHSSASLTNFNGTLFLFTRTPEGQLGLYKMPGGSDGAFQLVAPVGPRLDQYDDYSYANRMAVMNGKLFFVGSDPMHGDELWVTDGTTAGTRLAQDIAKAGGSRPDRLTVFQNTLYFVADDGIHGKELWKLTEVNDRPVVANLGSDITYRENAAPIFVAPTATIDDADSPNFAGGMLMVRIVENAESPDRLTIQNAGMVTTRGRDVLFGEHVIGTWAGGVGGVALTVSFNGKASPYRAQAVLRNVAYSNLSENPSALPRTVRAQLTDGDGGLSPWKSKTINVVPVNDAHKITVSSAPIGYQMNAAGIAVMAEAVLTDVDNLHFGGGKLVVRVTEPDAGNRLEIGGGFTVSNSQVMIDGIILGTLSWQGGIGERNLAVTFNSNATIERVENLMRSIRFRTVGAAEAKPRTLEISLLDGAWPVATVTKTVNVGV